MRSPTPSPVSQDLARHHQAQRVDDKITPTEAVTRTPSVSISGVKGTAAPRIRDDPRLLGRLEEDGRRLAQGHQYLVPARLS
jgi:hypothetical protein